MEMSRVRALSNHNAAQQNSLAHPCRISVARSLIVTICALSHYLDYNIYVPSTHVS